ncbi:MAG: hypothetical protein ACOC1O_05915 [bacterium]
MAKKVKKWPYVDGELLKQIKLKFINNNKRINISKLGREVWKIYLEKDFDLKGYKNIIEDKGRLKNIAKYDNKVQILMDEELSNDIDLKVAELEKKYKDKDNQYYSITWITNELLKRLFIDEEYDIDI